ncbi:MAG TPA: RdgB/HAM1 family non-canonical purine NTP pyrophosphatase [Bryobacteraceae bacterium]|nr:RdgB/HAM1 family non-canonical purine NTP pyrophosphatase [Bryobacteraceae bacterium]
MKLWCATGNAGKMREFRLAAGRYDVDLEMLPEYASIPPCEETGATFEENAVLKATYYGKYASGLLFADDSGLEVDALGGAPGVYSARYAGPEANDEANNRLLLQRLQGVEDRTARFVCVIALVDGERVLGTFRGTVEGRMLEAPRGADGFGYDPLFYYPPFRCSFGEASAGSKLEVSHRGQALRAMLQYLIE